MSKRSRFALPSSQAGFSRQLKSPCVYRSTVVVRSRCGQVTFGKELFLTRCWSNLGARSQKEASLKSYGVRRYDQSDSDTHGVYDSMNDYDSLPPPLQRAITTRDSAVKPFDKTIDSFDVSWTIVEGNLKELLGTIDVFDTNDQAKALALWQQSPPVKHRYHLDIVRRLHNFLSAAVAHLDHSRRAATLFKRLAPDSYRACCDRQDCLDERLNFLIAIRDFSLHAGTHASVLTLQGTEAGTFSGRVGFNVSAMLAEQEARLASVRTNRHKAAATAAVNRLKTAGSMVEIRPLVADYYERVQAHRSWLRKELIDVHARLSADLAQWASADDRPAVVQYFIDHPIPVYGKSDS